MHILDITIKDITQILRDKKALLFLLIMPVVFTLLMGFAFRGVAAPEDSKLTVGWLNQDPGGLIADSIAQMLQSSETIRLEKITPDEAENARLDVSQGTLPGLLVVPPDYSLQVFAGKNPQIEVFIQPGTSNGQLVQQVVRPSVTRVLSSVKIASMQSGRFEPDSPQQVEIQRTAFALAVEKWNTAVKGGVQVENIVAQGEASRVATLGGNPYNQTSPGIMVMFTIASLFSSAVILVQERKSRTLERMQTTAVSRPKIIAGHFLAMFILIFVQEVILVVFAQLALKVDYLSAPSGTLLLITTLALWTASLGMLIGVAAKGEDQVILYSMASMFIFSALGGAWFPLEGVGKTFAAIAKITPTAWAMTGFQNILVRGLGSSSAVLPALILASFAVLFFIAGVAVFQKKA